MNEELGTSREQPDIEGDIKALKKQIREKKKSMELDLQALEKSKSNVDFGEDEFEELQADKVLKSINEDMTATENRYSAEIKTLKLKIKSLQ